MATYKKPLKAFRAFTLMGYSALAEDTADGKRLGSYAIDAFEGKKTIETEDADVKILVPFHAVKTAMYATMTEDAEKADAYCGGGTEPIGEVWYTGTLGECESGYASALLEETDKAKTSDLLTNPTEYAVSINGIALIVAQVGSHYVTYADSADIEQAIISVTIGDNGTHDVYVKCPTDITTIEVTVAHK